MFTGTNDETLVQKQPHQATLQDVADLAGVCRSTASSVLNGSSSNTRTSPATRERVRKAAVELAYRPNAVARSLRRRAIHTIGFYNGVGYIDARNPFLSAVIAGMHAGCDRSDYELLFHRVARPDDLVQQFQNIISGKVDGVVLYTQSDDPVVDMLAERRFPAVAIADAHPKVPSVTADDEGGSRLAARRLAARGHKRILYRMPPVWRVSADNRHRGFIDEAKILGLHVQTSIAADFKGTLTEEEIAILSGPQDIRPTGVACWNDGSALETYQYFRATGQTGKCDVIGFDGFEHPWLSVTLTTIHVPWDVVAMTAVDTVRDIIAGKPVKQRTLVPLTLLEGGTG